MADDTAGGGTTPAPGTVLRPGAQRLNLALATWAFAINFWAWNLIGPLSPTYARTLGLSSTRTALLVAVPVLVGAVGRIPVGALTDRFGGRVMFGVVSFLTIIPVLWVGFAHSFTALLAGGFVLGIAGTSFAVGVPFCNAWYERARRGFATGVFGAGMGGTALSAFFTPRLADAIGRAGTHVAIAGALAATGLLMLVAARNSPAWRPSTAKVLPRLAEVSRLRVTWQTAALYAVAFGGFVAFSTYLPTYLKNVYEFGQVSAGMRTAGFAIAAVVARPLGGTLSDRVGARAVLIGSFALTFLLAVAAATEPAPEVAAGTVFVLLAAALGLGSGGVFALVGRLVEPARVGSVTGVVGAAGGLGGYFPPLVMGVVYEATGSYVIGLLLLGGTALAALVFTAVTFRGARGRIGNRVPAR